MISKLDKIPDGTTNKKELVNIKKLEDIRLSLNAKIDLLVSQAFNLYQQLSSPSLGGEWDDIVQDFCFMARWIDGKNVVSTENRDQD